jgi:hypothetical protein
LCLNLGQPGRIFYSGKNFPNETWMTARRPPQVMKMARPSGAATGSSMLASEQRGRKWEWPVPGTKLTELT